MSLLIHTAQTAVLDSILQQIKLGVKPPKSSIIARFLLYSRYLNGINYHYGVLGFWGFGFLDCYLSSENGICFFRKKQMPLLKAFALVLDSYLSSENGIFFSGKSKCHS